MDAYEAERKRLLTAFAVKLRALREKEYPTQEDLANATKLHRTHIGYLEQARREPSLSTLLILAETFDVSVQELIEGLPAPRRRRPKQPRRKR
jgi:transcriptional regulator with XRE-family HTH domain